MGINSVGMKLKVNPLKVDLMDEGMATPGHVDVMGIGKDLL